MSSGVVKQSGKIFQLRRASTSAGHAQSSSVGSSSLKVHKSTESTMFPTAVRNGSPVSTTLGFSATTPQKKMIKSLVNRIRDSLPVYSGKSLEALEADAVSQQIVETLVEHAKQGSDHAVWSLTDLINSITALKSPNADELAISQSQLYLLKILYYVLANRGQSSPQNLTHRASTGSGNTSLGGRGSPALHLHDSIRKKPSYGSDSTSRSPSNSILDGRAITDDIAKFCLNAISAIIRQAPDLSLRIKTAASMDADFLLDELETTDYISTPFTVLSSQIRSSGPPAVISELSNGSVTSLPDMQGEFGRSHFSDLVTPETLVKSQASVSKLIYKFASHVVFYLSATNWDVVFMKVQENLRNFGDKPVSKERETLADFKLICSCALDRSRLVQFLQEVASLLINLPPITHQHIAYSIRKAVWSWIQIFPIEFADVLQHGRRLDNASERLFDLLFARTDDSNKHFMWPALIALLAISRDRLREAEVQFNAGVKIGRGLRKRTLLMDQLSRALHESSPSVSADVALICYIDLCQASLLLPSSLENLTLRTFAPDLVAEVTSYLSRPQWRVPFYESDRTLDISLYSDALSVLFRCNPETTVKEFFQVCLEPSRSNAVKLCVFRACLGLTTDMRRLPVMEAQSLMNPLYTVVTPRVRAIFKAVAAIENELSEDGKPIARASLPSLLKAEGDITSSNDLLALSIIALFRADPAFLLYGVHSEQQHDTWTQASVLICQKSQSPNVRLAAIRAFEGFSANPNYISHGIDYSWEVFNWVYTAATHLLKNFSLLALEARGDIEEERLFAGLLKFDLQWWASTDDNDESRKRKYSPERLDSLATAEIALLLFLTSPNSSVTVSSCEGLRALAHAERHDEAPKPKHFNADIYGKRLRVYDQLRHPKLDVLGRVAQQKWVRTQLKVISTPCATFTAVWMEAFRRFMTLHDKLTEKHRTGVVHGSFSVYNPQVNPLPLIECLAEFYKQSLDGARWSNLLLFLAAFSGCHSETENIEPLDKIIPSVLFPQDMLGPMRISKSIVTLFRLWFDLLTDEVADVRQTVKEALGSELHANMIPMFFMHLESYLKEYFDTNIEPDFNQSTLRFLDAVLYILQAMLNRQDEHSLSVLSITDFDHTMVLAKYLDGLDAHRDIEALQLRERFCGLCDSIVERRTFLGFRSECRNDLLHKITSWMQEPEEDLEDTQSYHLHRAYRKAAMKALRTCVLLTDHLSLQPDQSAAASDSTHVVSGLFRDHHSRFLNAFWLQDRQPQESRIGESPSLKPFQDETVHVENLIIEGIGNMLLSNAAAGTFTCLDMALNGSSSVRKRYISCLVFSRVLRRGTKLGQSDLPSKEYRNALCDLIRNSKLSLPLALCEICPVNGDEKPLLSALLAIFNEPEELLALCQAAIDREVSRADSPSGLFRNDNMYNLLISHVGRAYGSSYLYDLLKHLSGEMKNISSGSSFDVEGPSVLPQNIHNLERFSKLILVHISRTVSSLPPIFSRICAHISAKTKERWPPSTYSAVGGFMFLRFICPVMIDPSLVEFDLPPESTVIRKGLQYIAKILLHLAGNILFRPDNPLSVMNEFLKNHMLMAVDVLRSLSTTVSRTRLRNGRVPPLLHYDEADAIFMHHFFADNADQVGKELLSSSKTNSAEDGEHGKQMWDGLCAALVEVGAVIKRPIQDSDPKTTEQLLAAHLKRYRGKNADSLISMFFKLPKTKDATDAFLLSLRQVQVETVEFELLVCHVLKLLMQTDGMFDVIIDCTGFTSASELPIQWVKMFLQLIPQRLSTNFEHAYIVSSNGLAQRYIRKLHSVCYGFLLAHDVIVLPDFDALSKENPNIVLPEDYPIATSTGYGNRHLYTDVEFYRDGPPGRLVLEISSMHIKLSTTNRRRLLSTLQAVAVDVIWLSEITDTYIGYDLTDFVICRKEDRIYLTSPSRDEIVKELKIVKQAAKDTGPRSLGARPFTELEMSATLLHIGLWNACHEDQHLRSAAQSLLVALASSLGLDGSKFLATKAVLLPQHPVAFVSQFSERLAMLSPELTLSFLQRYSEQLRTGSERQKLGSLQYVSFWIRNLPSFWDPVSNLYDASESLLRPILLSFVEALSREDSLSPALHRHIWHEFKALETSFVGYVAEVLSHATQNSPEKYSIVSDAFLSLSSSNISTKTLIRTRRHLMKTLESFDKTRTDDCCWRELELLIGLCHMSIYNSKCLPSERMSSENFFHVPDMLYLVTLLASMGPLSMRLEVYGIAVTLFQTFYMNSDSVATKGAQLAHEVTTPRVLKMFGLAGDISTGRYRCVDPISDEQALGFLECLTTDLLRHMEETGLKTGLINAWKARYSSLIMTTVFGESLWLNARACVILSSFSFSEIDDDTIFQMVTVLQRSLQKAKHEDAYHIQAILHSMSNMVPQMRNGGDWLQAVVWLAIVTLSLVPASLFSVSSRLLLASMETACRCGGFHNTILTAMQQTLVPALKMTVELDALLKLSLGQHFNFSLAFILFKGVRPSVLRDQTRKVLEGLMRVTVACSGRNPWEGDPQMQPMHPEVLPYFIALLPYAVTHDDLAELLKTTGAGSYWLETIGVAPDQTEPKLPRIPLGVLGNMSENTVLLTTSFLCVLLRSSSPNDDESVILYTLLADIASHYPDTVATCCEGLMPRMLSAFGSSNNLRILDALDTVFRVSIDDARGPAISLHDHRYSSGSAASLLSQHSNDSHEFMLRELGMEHMANPLTFIGLEHTESSFQFIGRFTGLLFGSYWPS